MATVVWNPPQPPFWGKQNTRPFDATGSARTGVVCISGDPRTAKPRPTFRRSRGNRYVPQGYRARSGEESGELPLQHWGGHG